MDTHFKILMENEIKDVLVEAFRAKEYVDGHYSWTDKGKKRDRIEHEPKMELLLTRAKELFVLNYPTFVKNFDGFQKMGVGTIYIYVARIKRV